MSLGRHLVQLLRGRVAAGLPRAIVDKPLLHVADAVGIACADLSIAVNVSAALRWRRANSLPPRPGTR
jgi:hypothetical protein